MRSGSEASRRAVETHVSVRQFQLSGAYAQKIELCREVFRSRYKRAVLVGIRDYGDGIIGFLVQASMAERPVVLPPQRARAPWFRVRRHPSRFRAKLSCL
jgi:hypothetical protein